MMFMRDEKGSTSIEYAILVSLVALVIAAGLSLIGDQLSTIFDNANSGFTISVSGGGGSGGGGNNDNRSGLGDGSNPGQGHGRDNSPNEGTDNPGQGRPWP